jgi:hypothetical protein
MGIETICPEFSEILSNKKGKAEKLSLRVVI